ncbi:MAG: OsmC family protein [Crocinitomicaceae bacterium]|nr:OsmC family protein [Crocinitomicaceae bacterium]
MEQHIVKATWKEGVHFEADAPGGILNMDGAEEIGGKGKGYRPKALMLSAMAGCTGIDVAMLIEKMRVQIDGFSIDVEAELTDEHPKIYKNTHIVFTFKSANPDKEKLEKAVNLSFDKYCGVIAMFKSFSTVTKEIRYVS